MRANYYPGWHEETIDVQGMRKSLDRPLTLANGWTSNFMIQCGDWTDPRSQTLRTTQEDEPDGLAYRTKLDQI